MKWMRSGCSGPKPKGVKKCYNNRMNPGPIILIFKNILDITIIAFLIYILVMLFIKVKSTPIIVGVLVIILLYGASTFLNLTLTQIVLKPFFGIFLVILAVVFQKELRRFFEMIGVLGLRQKIHIPKESTLKIISDTIWKLADSRTGALFVFPGRESFERHLEGGFALDGVISESLLLSIFDESSPGHDGAVIIEGDKIKSFAVHLPLAEKFEAIKKFGLRHRAALGISEKTDTLCVVVSEERGTVSISSHGKLEIVQDKESLEKKLKSFFEEIGLHHMPNSYSWLKRNFVPIAISFGIAIILWLFWG